MTAAQRRVAARLAAAAAALASAESAGFYLYWWWRVFSGTLQGPDFFAFYAAARLFLARGGGAVYNLAAQTEFQAQVTSQWGPGPFTILPYIHPPHFTVLIAPLGWLPYRTAYLTWSAVNLALAVVAGAVLIRGNLQGWWPRLAAGACLAGFLPLFVTLLQGQSDMLILVFLAASLAAWTAGREGTAGALAALAMIKPQLLLLLPVLFLVRRSGRAILGLVVVGFGLVLLSLAAVGLGGVRDYLGIVLPWLVGGNAAWPISGQSMYSVRGIFEALPGGRITSLVALVLLVLVAAYALLRGRPDRRLDFALAVAASVALSPYLNLHDLVLLAVPAFAIAALIARGRLRRPALAVAAIALVAVGTELTLLVGAWSALLGVVALAAYLLSERLVDCNGPLDTHEEPLAIGQVGNHRDIDKETTNPERGHPVEHFPDLIGDQ